MTDQPIQQGESPVSARTGADADAAFTTPSDPCPYCGGNGYTIGGDEWHLCWCRQPDPDVRAKGEW